MLNRKIKQGKRIQAIRAKVKFKNVSWEDVFEEATFGYRSKEVTKPIMQISGVRTFR